MKYALIALALVATSTQAFETIQQLGQRNHQQMLQQIENRKPTTVYRSDGSWSSYRENNVGGATVQHSDGRVDFIVNPRQNTPQGYDLSW